MKKFTLSLVLFLAVMVFVGGNQVSAQTTSVDVSSSYQVTVQPVSFFERLKLVFTFNAEKKAQVLQDFSNRSFALANLKLSEGKTQEASVLFQKSDDYTLRAATAISRIKDEEKRTTASSAMSVTASNRTEALTQAKANVENPVAKEALDRAITRQQVSVDTNVSLDNNANQNAVNRAGNNTGTTLGSGGVGISAVNSVCTPATTPYIKVLSPNGGEEYSNTDELKVEWESCNIASSATLSVELLHNTDGIMVAFVPNTGSHIFQLSPASLMNPPVSPSQPVTYGQNFKAYVGTPPTTFPSYQDGSDNLFKIGEGQSESQSVCNLNIQTNQTVSFPLSITGQISIGNVANSVSCPLGLFEGQVGIVQAYSASGVSLSSWTALMIYDPNFDYQPGTYNFSGVLNMTNTVSSGQTIILKFTKEDPSDAPPVSFDIPVVVQ